MTVTRQHECTKCRKLVMQTQVYFFRYVIGDCTGSIEVGFARQYGEKLFEMNANEFRKNLTKHEVFSDFIKQKVLLQELKLTIKKKTERFNGETRNRYYCMGVENITNVTSDHIAEYNKSLLHTIKDLIK